MYRPLPTSVMLKKSSIHGYGLFANHIISKNSLIGISHVAHEGFPNGYIRTPLGGFYNHSEKPNCELIERNLDMGFSTYVKILTAKRDIREGEDLTCTYTLWDNEDIAKLSSDNGDNWLGL